MMPVWLSLAVVLAALAWPEAQNRPTFRSQAEGVELDVSVWAAGQPVDGLTIDDIEVWEDGVRQTVIDVQRDDGPIAVTFGLDFALVGRWIPDPTRLLDEVRLSVRADDHMEILWFGRQVGRTPPADLPSVRSRHPSALFDGILAAAMGAPPAATRLRHLVVAVTQGLDRSAAIPPSMYHDVLRASGSVVHIVAPINPARSFVIIGQVRPGDRGGRVVDSNPVGDYDVVLRSFVRQTGGRFFEVPDVGRIREVLARAVNEYRGRYWVRFRPGDTGAVRRWRVTEVKVSRPGRYDVWTRSGYWR